MVPSSMFLISTSHVNETCGTHGVLMVRIFLMRSDLVGGKKKPVEFRFSLSFTLSLRSYRYTLFVCCTCVA